MVQTHTVDDLLEGHAVLDVECLDRIYLNGYVPGLQAGGQVVTFLRRHLGYPIASAVIFAKLGTSFRAAVTAYAGQQQVPFVRFGKGDRKVEVMQPYLDAQAATGASGVAAIGIAQEFQNVYAATQTKQGKTAAGGVPQFSFYKADRRVTCYYFYLWDEDFGPAFIKICSYFPYPIKVWVNGHEWAKRQAAKAGIGFTELSNGFAACDDPPALQGICDQLGPDDIEGFFDYWMTRIPTPLNGTDRAAGYWWELSMRQVEVSRTIVLDQPRNARAFMEALVADNIDIGRPERIEVVFKRDRRGRKAGPPSGGVFKTGIDQHVTGITLNAFWRHSRIKQYLKDGRAMRVETVINSPDDLDCPRRLQHLPQLQDRARACNRRLLHAERVGQGCVLTSPAFERIARPTVTDDGRRAPALRFGDPRVQALAGALCNCLSAVCGITNKSLRALMPPLLGDTTATSYTMNQASYDLARLRLNGLIARIPGHNRYTLTTDGQKFAIFYTKIHDRILRPLLTTDQPTTPAKLRTAMRTIDQHINQQLAQARLPTPA